MNFRYFLIILLIVPVVFGAKFDNYNITYDASSSQITIDTNIFLESNTSGLDFSIFTKPSSIIVDSSVPIDYHLDSSNGYKLVIDFLKPTSGNVNISINFKTDLIQSVSDRDIFSLAFRAPLDIEKFSFKLLLPETSQIYYQNDQPLISPQANIQTDGKRIILVWNSKLSKSDPYVILASFTKPKQEFPILPLIILGILLVGSVIFIMLRYSKKKSHDPIIKSMSEDERELFYLIKNEKGITQESLREKTGHSKSKISKVIRNLEKMDVVKKTPYKKTNKLESKL